MHTHVRCSNVSLFKEASLPSSPSLHNRCRHRYRRRASVCMRTHVPRDAFFHHAFLYLIVVTSHGLAHCQKVTFCINFLVELSTRFHNQAEYFFECRLRSMRICVRFPSRWYFAACEPFWPLPTRSQEGTYVVFFSLPQSAVM